jgi:tetratricopeptide (TPR) repeat protein
MSKMLLPLLTLGFAIHPAFAAGKLPKPDRVPTEPTPEQVALVREGVALHDQGRFADAIAKYKQVLARNPWEVRALHELAFTQFASKDYRGALETARLGAQCRSKSLAGFYQMIGSALDELGKGKEAIETYRAAIKMEPGMGLLHYNLAISLRRAGQPAEAKDAVEQGLESDPNHASSHALLGEVYQEMGYRVPAIMAYSRFLVLEPESPRAGQVLTKLSGLLSQGASKGKENQINIFMQAPSKSRQDEGDFGGADLGLSMALALDFMKKPEEAKEPPKSPFQKLASLYVMLGATLDNSKPKGGFAAAYYAPYFSALHKAGHTESFVAHAWKAGKVEGASDWAAANEAKIGAFLAWSKSYQWPEK